LLRPDPGYDMGTAWILIPAAYLLGSVPSSVWLGRWFKGVDLRELGSGNAGATNAFRVLGSRIGLAVLVLDISKGFLAVNLSFLLPVPETGTEAWMLLRTGLGIVAVTGHVFPVLAGFRGGKGVATLAGVGLALHPLSAVCALGIYGLAYLVTRISSAGSLAAVLSYPLWVMLVFGSQYRPLWAFSILVPVMVLVTHRENIRRLLKGREG